MPYFDLAMIHAGLGEKDLTLECLEKAFKERAWELGQLEIDPMFKSMRADPRFSNTGPTRPPTARITGDRLSLLKTP